MKILRMAFAGLLILGIANPVYSRPITNKIHLEELSRQLAEKLDSHRTPLYYQLLESKSSAQQKLNAAEGIKLMFIDDLGFPVYYAVDNLNAARTISTDDVWPGGSGGFSLDGSGTTLGKLGVWDGGGVRVSHSEYQGRVTQMDVPSEQSYHATHVSGTMVAAGLDAAAKGMSPAAELAAYEWTYDDAEMASAGLYGINVSNHSYSNVHGWYYDEGDWYWYGNTNISATEDYHFGYYSEYPRDWDEIAFDAPYYLIVKSAGNDRNDFGPGEGGEHYVFNYIFSTWDLSTDTRDFDGGSTGYDCLPQKATAKNILSVGAVGDVPDGYSSPAWVAMSSFSSWGPTDDGRIKPDIVANGVGLYSCDNDDDNDYITLGGTSMSAPSAAGSVNSLFRYYENTHSSETPLSSTMKGLVIHTADECGPSTGPDYMFGWGLMKTLKAAQMIQLDSAEASHIMENSLLDGESDRFIFPINGDDHFRFTICWTDLPGIVPPVSLDPPNLILIHDLDLHIIDRTTSTIYYPYVLDPSNPSEAATKGDNFRDNVEQVYFEAPPGGIYELYVTHKDELHLEQFYSLISSHKLWLPGSFLCGDANDDGKVNVGDVVFLVNVVFRDGAFPDPIMLGDVNCDGRVNVGDAVFMTNYVFKEGAPVPCADCE